MTSSIHAPATDNNLPFLEARIDDIVDEMISSAVLAVRQSLHVFVTFV